MGSRGSWEPRGGRPPTPPPRDPSGINSIVQQHASNNNRAPDEDAMSSDSSAAEQPPDRRSSYDNVDDPRGFYPSKPPAAAVHRRSRESSLQRATTPSPRPQQPHVRCSPCPRACPSPRHDWASDPPSDEASSEPPSVRRRPASACRAPRSHRGSMPPVDYLAWAHHAGGGCSPCCAPSPLPYHWCGPPQTWPHMPMHANNEASYDYDDLQQKVCQLEAEKDQLALQVNVLSEQVDAQNEKILELENSLSQRKEQLKNSEALLRQELSSRSSAENNKLDLMAQISSLRLRLATVEHEKKEIEERNTKLENELILTCACLAEKEADLATIKSRMARNGAITPIFDTNPEVEKLKGALTSVMAANDEKEKRIQEMSRSLSRYKKLHELVLSNPSRRASDGMTKKTSDESFLSAHDIINSFDLDSILESSFDYNLTEKPPPAPRTFQANLASVPEDLLRPSSRFGETSRYSPLFSPIRGESPSPFSSLNINKYSSSENVSPPTPQKTPPAKRHYSTLPRPHGDEILQKYTKSPCESTPVAMSAGQTSHSFHNLHHSSLEVSRPSRSKASSAHENGDEVVHRNAHIQGVNSNYRRPSSPLASLPPKEKAKGFRRIFGKVKRTGSENLSPSEAEFKRGGIRATAGPRLGWSEDFKIKRESFKVNKPFAEWDCTMICDWLLNIGLGMYVPECKKGIKNGDQLLKASTHDFEKELGMKNPLHRKKLLLAVCGAKEETGDNLEPAGKIDYQWVVRWLDDIGLPQYKDAFYDARIDGRMLHHLTLEDLAHLKVTNLLHHISIKTGILVLRENKFDVHCLTRRSLPDDENNSSSVSKWTNHRVMEWLKTVDLSEYAPNLRGSGVHGGLMMHEPRFTADLLATLLNIPPNKTLLRRHLNTQFKQLIGPDVMQKKREWEAQPNFIPLSPSAKVKVIKKSHFSIMKKKNKNEFALDDYVCPMNFSEKMFGNSAPTNGSKNGLEEEKFLMKEGVLKNENLLESMPASNV
ncbi:liprin-beta-2-like isoform X2 [Uloborus diversus]|uniref:liprin-beta-2-like isoform X2 n=1 Tax=Uloborus diversus TaxID=327109 RepID=UPI00240A2148|nr:liprin-beta-2-like isoform X2 [Uloborus diversus]